MAARARVYCFLLLRPSRTLYSTQFELINGNIVVHQSLFTACSQCAWAQRHANESKPCNAMRKSPRNISSRNPIRALFPALLKKLHFVQLLKSRPNSNLTPPRSPSSRPPPQPSLPVLLPLPRNHPRLALILFLFLFTELLKKLHSRPAAQPLSSQQALQLPCQAEGCDL
jgi:hypothetical protein